MSKIFWLDVETTGINARKNDITQLAYLIEMDNDIIDQGEMFFKPKNMRNIDAKALEITGRTLDELNHFPVLEDGITELQEIMSQYVDRYNKADKFVPAGYNVRFDLDFLRQSFLKTGDKYFGSWYTWPSLDVQTFVALYVISGHNGLPNYQLSTLCDHFQIPINAHDALSDVKATRMLYSILRGRLATN